MIARTEVLGPSVPDTDPEFLGSAGVLRQFSPHAEAAALLAFCCSATLLPTFGSQKKFWYPVCLSTSLPAPDARGRYDPPGHRPASIRLLGTPLVLYRTKLPPRRYRRPSDEAGAPLAHISVCPETHKGGASRYGPAVKWRPVCLADKCPHKNTKLSVGKVVDGT